MKKCGKKVEDSCIIFTVGNETHSFDTKLLPIDIQKRLIPFGAGHKMGDAANTAKTPEEVVAALTKTWEGLMEGKWTVRVEAAEPKPKISIKTIAENLAKLPQEQQEAAKKLLAEMGFSL